MCHHLATSLNAPFGAQCFPTYKHSLKKYPHGSQCTFWCSVLSDRGSGAHRAVPRLSQCTFWCSVLSDLPAHTTRRRFTKRLNAPFGAQCFPTCKMRLKEGSWTTRLNAPFGAQCFPTVSGRPPRRRRRVSMHLLVLSAFRRPKAAI